MLQRTLLLLVLSGLIGQSGCQSVDQRPSGPEKVERFTPVGHLQQDKTVPETAETPIPDLSDFDPIHPGLDEVDSSKLYSVSALNVPVQELMLQLAEDAGQEFDIHQSVKGEVTLNAIDQPLNNILQRIVSQVDAVYSHNNNAIVIRPDSPYWHSYEIDYVNIVKNIQDTTVMNMSVGNVVDETAGQQSGNSEFRLETASEQSFWRSLEESLQAMVAQDSSAPLSTVVNRDDSSAERSPQSDSAPQPSERSRVVLHKEGGLISAFATQKSHQQIQAFLDQLTERTNRQVLIEATVVEVELSDEYQAGIDWSVFNESANTSSSAANTIVGNNNSVEPNLNVNFMRFNWDFDLGVRFLERFGDAKVLSSPKIMAMNNQTALLKVVKNEVYFTLEVNREAATTTSAGVTTFETNLHSVPVGFMMHVTPFVNNDRVTLNVRPTLTSIIDFKDDPNPELANAGVESKVPIIREREMDSVLRLLDQQTAVIGGLIQDSLNDVDSGVPGLKHLPFIGPAFDYQEKVQRKTELIIFIRPTIVKNPDIEHGDLKAFRPMMQTRSMRDSPVAERLNQGRSQ
ncbi:type II secretion system protein GspD [Thiomicrospira sp. WB1]|uniref:type II secretion system protein GspD n=1 Tax=Thiomicrospira sp. WB1 TaxID=1685380 RepID=UPI00074A728B|nr:type II and III secretion system protein [Thiomicrospira sp. WB1]KUJ72733.1 type II and III secretion system protein [Thiomicrospira sp. WB1]